MERIYSLSWNKIAPPAPLNDYPSTNYFCIHTLTRNTTITFNPYYQYDYQYSFDGLTWTTFNANNTTTIELTFSRDHVYLRCNNPQSTYYAPVITFNSLINISGKLSTLFVADSALRNGSINNNNVGGIVDLEYLIIDSAHCSKLFSRMTSDLKSLPVFDSLLLTGDFSYMFMGDDNSLSIDGSNLIIPALPSGLNNANLDQTFSSLYDWSAGKGIMASKYYSSVYKYPYTLPDSTNSNVNTMFAFVSGQGTYNPGDTVYLNVPVKNTYSAE